MQELLKKIFKDNYGINDVKSSEAIVSGLINSTHKVETSDGVFIVQKMNQNVFPNIKALLNNKTKITNFLTKKGFNTVEFIKDKSGEYYTEIDKDIWQVSKYIPSVTHNRMTSSAVAGQVGAYLAEFHKALLDFPVSELEYTIPDFHNTIKRYADYTALIDKATPERLAKAKECISFLKTTFPSIEKVATAINNGTIPLRAVHNDTKVGNMLFDEKGNIICIIDFDTMMPGSLLHDVGDAMRTGANTSTEDDPDLSKVCFDVTIYDAFMNAYTGVAKEFMTKEEAENIHLSLPLLLFEQGCRFLGDYLNNDAYYATKYEDHNLVRAKTQVKLLGDVLSYLRGK